MSLCVCMCISVSLCMCVCLSLCVHLCTLLHVEVRGGPQVPHTLFLGTGSLAGFKIDMETRWAG